MAVYKNITGATANDILIKKGPKFSGNISKILIANVNTSNAVTITVDLHDGTNTFTLIKEVDIPVKSSLVLEDNVKFDSTVFNLRITVAGTSPNISVIIR
tara:strand:- start:56 stop:355 length:300 start_codon:yes stop_codon:yes gene_type:complete